LVCAILRASHWANHFLDGDSTTLSIVTGWQQGRLVMVWPLVTMRVARLRQISWMGEPISQYGDVLVENGPGAFDLLRQGWAYVLSLRPDVINLRKARSDAVIAPLLAETGMTLTGVSAAPYVELRKAADLPFTSDVAQQRNARTGGAICAG
jgi:CelD/BcsL family acetyltransferase involved in cellulose biosynthesis